ncbi:MAG: hypothetical protein AAFP68_04020 [Pseudomonadota bacterium]
MSNANQKTPREVLGDYLALGGILLMLASIAGIFIAVPFIGWPSLGVGAGLFILAGLIRPKDADAP